MKVSAASRQTMSILSLGILAGVSASGFLWQADSLHEQASVTGTMPMNGDQPQNAGYVPPDQGMPMINGGDMPPPMAGMPTSAPPDAPMNDQGMPPNNGSNDQGTPIVIDATHSAAPVSPAPSHPPFVPLNQQGQPVVMPPSSVGTLAPPDAMSEPAMQNESQPFGGMQRAMPFDAPSVDGMSSSDASGMNMQGGAPSLSDDTSNQMPSSDNAQMSDSSAPDVLLLQQTITTLLNKINDMQMQIDALQQQVSQTSSTDNQVHDAAPMQTPPQMIQNTDPIPMGQNDSSVSSIAQALPPPASTDSGWFNGFFKMFGW